MTHLNVSKYAPLTALRKYKTIQYLYENISREHYPNIDEFFDQFNLKLNSNSQKKFLLVTLKEIFRKLDLIFSIDTIITNK